MHKINAGALSVERKDYLFNFIASPSKFFILNEKQVLFVFDKHHEIWNIQLNTRLCSQLNSRGKIVSAAKFGKSQYLCASMDYKMFLLDLHNYQTHQVTKLLAQVSHLNPVHSTVWVNNLEIILNCQNQFESIFILWNKSKQCIQKEMNNKYDFSQYNDNFVAIWNRNNHRLDFQLISYYEVRKNNIQIQGSIQIIKETTNGEALIAVRHNNQYDNSVILYNLVKKCIVRLQKTSFQIKNLYFSRDRLFAIGPSKNKYQKGSIKIQECFCDSNDKIKDLQITQSHFANSYPLFYPAVSIETKEIQSQKGVNVKCCLSLITIGPRKELKYLFLMQNLKLSQVFGNQITNAVLDNLT